MPGTSIKSFAFCLLLTCTGAAHADSLDNAVNAALKRQNIPGLAIGIEQGGSLAVLMR
ncbi:hypothetical protein [Novosphingobium sp. Chol11]|uniref:hypothetical protein n=1 Tax=Novosphingobium sp. Chol11 TaxID=1385763 RepID=UPI0025EC8310|nr:hypothetical protein [Novosphingobium sp. Chol11]